MKNIKLFLLLVAVTAGWVASALVINVTGSGIAKMKVELDAGLDSSYRACLRRNLELTGLFEIVTTDAAVKVGVSGGSVVARGAASTISGVLPTGNGAEDRMAARKFSDSMVAAFGKASGGKSAKGFACDRLSFMNRAKDGSCELYVAYPDGFDMQRLTRDGKPAIGARWKDSQTIYYVAYLNGGQQIWEINTTTGKRKMVWNLRGVASPAAVSPDGTKVAVVASFQGNPELYVVSGGNLLRMTRTPTASEGCPSWSPDGRQIAYMSDETRHQQLYIVDVATRKTRRITSKGRDNMEPDWGPDGRIAYVSRSQGLTKIAVLDPAAGDKSSVEVTDAGSWEHPSWSRDGRHLVASRDKALFIVDTNDEQEGKEAPKIVFKNAGNWIDPSWLR